MTLTPRTHDFLARLPKVELHLHIEGSLTPALMFELAAEQGIVLPYASLKEVEAAYDFADLPAFLALYYQGMGVLIDASHFYRLAQDYFRRASADGVRHLELFFDPQAHLARGVSLEVQFVGLERACLEAEREFDITSALVPSFLRCHSAESARELFDALIPFESRFVGVGLDSAEIGNPPEKFTEVFQLAGERGWHRVAHAGEEGPAEYIRTALEVLGVERIDHGVRCLEDAALVAELAERRIPLTVCPLSNVALKVVERMEDHPLPKLIDAGLNITLNSDDPSYFGGGMLDNFVAVQQALSLSEAQWITLCRNAIEAAFPQRGDGLGMSDARRCQLLAQLDTCAV